jgi:hypothetical protein
MSESRLQRRIASWPDLALETTLYQPVKNFLEGLGFTVKGEIGGCDLVALKVTIRRSS